MKYWKDAASLILAANITRRSVGLAQIPQTIITGTANPSTSNSSSKKDPGQRRRTLSNVEGVRQSPLYETDYSILLLQRAQSSTFFAGAEVFPGGALDDADVSPDWIDLFKEAGVKNTRDFGKMLSIQGPRPLLFKNKQESQLPYEVAFRICAIRETFEEAGVLLLKPFQEFRHKKKEITFAKNYEHPSFTEDIIDEWRHRVHEDASQFIVLCRELQCVPDVWSLMEWCDWLTPANNKKRYDTMFFLCCMKDAPVVKHDAKEMVQTKWSSSTEALQAFKDKQLYLPPPQIYELSRIKNFETLQELFEFSSRRAFLGCETTFPVLFLSEDGKVVSIYPGDDLYPEEPEFKTITSKEIEVLNKTAEQSLKDSTRLNRMVFIDSTECCLYYSIIPSCGHVAPVLYNIEGAVISKM